MSSHLFGFCLFVVNHDFFNNLQDQEREFILEAAKETINYQYMLAEEDDHKLIDMIEKENVQIREMTILERSNFLEKVKEFHNNFFLQFPKMNFSKEI